MFFSCLLLNLLLMNLAVVSSIHKDDEKSETSGSSDSSLPLKKRMRPLNDETLIVPTKKAKYKGLVPQLNGHWGAQIYLNQKRIWLGTFKSSAEAAMAYDSAYIKLRDIDLNSHRNFPWSSITVQEPDFQKRYTTETVLNMIRDGSYQQKFRDFLSTRSQIAASINKVGSKQSRENEEFYKCTQLFQKELSPSDVGKLNRFVIPKKYAVKHLPYIKNSQNDREGEIVGDVEDVEVVIYDRAMRQWNFRYCYWRSSQSFVFTKGWSSFVKDKNLKQKDVVIFYTCQVPSNVETLEGQNKNFLMIDVHCFSEDGSLVPKEVKETVCNSSDETELVKKNKGGFMLFGVRIQ